MIKDSIIYEGSLPEEGEVDPMSKKKKKLQKAALKLKVERTGLTKAYCKTCCKTKSIAKFPVTPSGSTRNKANKSDKKRKNSPPMPYRPRQECYKCLAERKKSSGAYARQQEARRKRYHTDQSSRKVYKDAAQKTRALLSDSYLKKLLKAKGYKTSQITPAILKQKRDELKKVRESASNRTHEVRRKTGWYSKQYRGELSFSYLRSLIKNNKNYKGQEITLEMILKKKREILAFRRGIMYWNVAMTDEQRKRSIKERQQRRIDELTDGYITLQLKHRKDYNGEEITPEMIEAQRQKVLEWRERRTRGIKSPPAAQQLTDAYVRKLISIVENIPKEHVTQEKIDDKRKQIIAKRKRLKSKKVKKKHKKAKSVLK